jgi:hypothetical protein
MRFDLRKRGNLVVKGESPDAPAMTLAGTNKNAIAARSKQQARAVAK